MDEPFLVKTIAQPISTPRLNRGGPAPKANSVSDQVVEFHKSNSAPALCVITEQDILEHKHGYESTAPKIIHLTLLAFLLYIITGVAVFLFTPGMFRGHQTLKLVDALYFTVAALCKVGYGDIVPTTTLSKLFTSIFLLVGFGFFGIFLNGLVIYVLDKLEKVLSVASVTTVSYRDYAFKTVAGRCFAIIWLLSSTLAVVRAFLYLAEYRIERRNRKLARNILQRKLTFADRVAANMNRDGFIR